jgi:hypothetical protein
MVKLTIFELHSKHRKTHASANTAQRAKAKTQKKAKKKNPRGTFFFPSFFAIVDTPHTWPQSHTMRAVCGEKSKKLVQIGGGLKVFGDRTVAEKVKSRVFSFHSRAPL